MKRGSIFWLMIALFAIGLSFTSSVEAQDFIKNLITQSPGPLSDSHAEYDNLNGCINCHVKRLGGEVDNNKCLDCHQEIAVQLETEEGYHWNKPTCHDCHAEHQGRDHDIFAPEGWKDDFNHALETGYELRGEHAKINCNDCHNTYREHYKTGEKTESYSYLGAPTDCYSCHENVYEHEFKDRALLDCSQCHSTAITGWKSMAEPMKFDHDTTDYPLRGLHVPVKCSECHEPEKDSKRVEAFAPLAFGQCTDCHTDPHEGKFGNDCQACHSVFRDWNVIIEPKTGQVAKDFDHSTTDFPLIGYHQDVACESCHYDPKANFKIEDAKFDQCSDCHGFPHGEQFQDQKCTDCHEYEKKFTNPNFGLEEHNQTGFKLDGKHQVLDCNKCHFTGQFEEMEFSQCSDCHRNVHPEREIDQDCSYCHVTTSFSWIQFDHNKQTDFKLTGQHREVACLSCHMDQQFKDMPANNANPNCQACHQDTHGDSMSNNCADCHRTEGFAIVQNFSHEEVGQWALEGRHAELSCQKCHENHLLQDYRVPHTNKELAVTACVNCHMDIHDGAFGNSCQSCHNMNSFAASVESQVHDLGFFELKGAHNELTCNDCHADNTNIQGTGIFCQSCHEDNDPHQGKFGPHCNDCHTQTAWVPSTFRHNMTGFRLTGAHRYAECASCHANNIYQGLPNDCYFCHSDSFISNPTHNALGAGAIECSDCHSTIDWGIRRGGGLIVPE